VLKTPSSSDFEKAPEGMHIGRCYQVVDLGTRHDDKFDKATHKCRIGWELPTKLMKDGKPFMVNKQYTLSHHEKSQLRKDLESWYGKRFNTDELNKAGGFDLEKIIGRPCMINVVHSEDGAYANVGAITPMVEGLECPPAINRPVVFSFQSFNQQIFASFSEKMQQFLMESNEYKERTGQTTGNVEDIESDIPF